MACLFIPLAGSVSVCFLWIYSHHSVAKLKGQVLTQVSLATSNIQYLCVYTIILQLVKTTQQRLSIRSIRMKITFHFSEGMPSLEAKSSVQSNYSEPERDYSRSWLAPGLWKTCPLHDSSSGSYQNRPTHKQIHQLELSKHWHWPSCLEERWWRSECCLHSQNDYCAGSCRDKYFPNSNQRK